jgi:hypothetical protein
VRLDGLTIAEAARKLEGLPVIEHVAYPYRRETEDREALERQLELPKLSIPTLSELRECRRGEVSESRRSELPQGENFFGPMKTAEKAALGLSPIEQGAWR